MDFKFYIDEKIDMHFTEDALNMLNNKNPKRGKFKSFIDDYGNNIFHYLSLSEDPIKSYSIWNNKIKNEDFNHFGGVCKIDLALRLSITDEMLSKMTKNTHYTDSIFGLK